MGVAIEALDRLQPGTTVPGDENAEAGRVRWGVRAPYRGLGLRLCLRLCLRLSLRLSLSLSLDRSSGLRPGNTAAEGTCSTESRLRTRMRAWARQPSPSMRLA